MLEFMILSLFTSGMYISANKVIQWQTEKKEQSHLIAARAGTTSTPGYSWTKAHTS